MYEVWCWDLYDVCLFLFTPRSMLLFTAQMMCVILVTPGNDLVLFTCSKLAVKCNTFYRVISGGVLIRETQKSIHNMGSYDVRFCVISSFLQRCLICEITISLSIFPVLHLCPNHIDSDQPVSNEELGDLFDA